MTQLTLDETFWDDKELIKSWDESIEDFRKSHLKSLKEEDAEKVDGENDVDGEAKVEEENSTEETLQKERLRGEFKKTLEKMQWTRVSSTDGSESDEEEEAEEGELMEDAVESTIKNEDETNDEVIATEKCELEDDEKPSSASSTSKSSNEPLSINTTTNINSENCTRKKRFLEPFSATAIEMSPLCLDGRMLQFSPVVPVIFLEGNNDNEGDVSNKIEKKNVDAGGRFTAAYTRCVSPINQMMMMEKMFGGDVEGAAEDASTAPNPKKSKIEASSNLPKKKFCPPPSSHSSSSTHSHSHSIHPTSLSAPTLPTLPTNFGASLNPVLSSWYNCGYQTGYYMAQQEFLLQQQQQQQQQRETREVKKPIDNCKVATSSSSLSSIDECNEPSAMRRSSIMLSNDAEELKESIKI